MKNPIRPSHLVVTALFITIAGAVSSIGGCSWGKGEKSTETPAPAQSTDKPPAADGGIPAQPQPTATVTTTATATGTAAPGPTLLPPSLCGPGPCERVPGIPSALPPIPMLPPDYLTYELTSKHPKCLDRDASSRWVIVGPALGTGQVPVGHFCDNWDYASQSFEAFPNSTSILFPKGGLAVGDGENLTGLADVSKDLSPGGGKVDRHGRLSKIFPNQTKVRVKVFIDGAWTTHQWDDPIVVFLAPTSSGPDAAIAPTDVCAKYKTTNPTTLSPWLQRIWSRCQMAQTPHNVGVIRTMDKVWTEQKDHVALAARTEKNEARLDALEAKTVKEVKAAGDKEVPTQKVVGFDPKAPN